MTQPLFPSAIRTKTTSRQISDHKNRVKRQTTTNHLKSAACLQSIGRMPEKAAEIHPRPLEDGGRTPHVSHCPTRRMGAARIPRTLNSRGSLVGERTPEQQRSHGVANAALGHKSTTVVILKSHAGIRNSTTGLTRRSRDTVQTVQQRAVRRRHAKHAKRETSRGGLWPHLDNGGRGGRPLLKDPPRGGGGGGVVWGPGQPSPTNPPPPHIRKVFLRQKMKFIKGAGNLRPMLGTQTCFWPLTLPPPLQRGGGVVCSRRNGLGGNVKRFRGIRRPLIGPQLCGRCVAIGDRKTAPVWASLGGGGGGRTDTVHGRAYRRASANGRTESGTGHHSAATAKEPRVTAQGRCTRARSERDRGVYVRSAMFRCFECACRRLHRCACGCRCCRAAHCHDQSIAIHSCAAAVQRACHNRRQAVPPPGALSPRGISRPAALGKGPTVVSGFRSWHRPIHNAPLGSACQDRP